MQLPCVFPEEVDTYDPYTIRESINNAIAHQDYTLGGRINVVEFDDRLVFSNVGRFMPGDVHRVVVEDSPQEVYRNQLLVHAMFTLKMVDTIGGGIRKMFLAQSRRYFPMPDYRLEDSRVQVTFTGKILDMNYARLLAKNPDLSLEDILLLDQVQKGRPIDDADAKHLRSRKLIEGRKPNFFVAKPVAQITGQRAEYSKNAAFDQQYYLDLICKAIDEHGSLTRPEIDSLLSNKLPDWMDESQKGNRTEYLLKVLRRAGKIRNQRLAGVSTWMRS